jgi:SHS2 domain-containing protein
VKHWSTFEHTADIGLSARADTLGELLEALGDALCDVMFRRDAVTPDDTRQITLKAEDPEGLAVDFLTELMSLAQTDRYMIWRVRVVSCAPTAVSADVDGEPYDPKRHEFRSEVKAVTYHQLKIALEDGRWVARVILDL